MILCRSRIHYFYILQPVYRRGIKELIQILERHLGQLTIENNSDIRGSGKPYHTIIVRDAGHITKRFKNIGNRFIFNYRRKINNHYSDLASNLWFLSFYNHFI